MQDQFELRKQKNPRFSLRAFARLLKTDPSSLSRTLKGERIPSEATLKKWSQCLGYPRELMLPKLDSKKHFRKMDPEFANSHLSWVHPVLLEAMRLGNFEDRKTQICQSLALSEKQISEIIEMLQNIGAFTGGSGNSPLKVQSLSTFEIPSTSENRRAVQRRYLQMSQEALEQVPLEKRCHSTLSIALAEDDLPKAREILRKARMQIGKLSKNKTKVLDVVYNVSTSLYPVVK